LGRALLRRDLEQVCLLRAWAVLDDLEKRGPVEVALTCLKSAEDDLKFLRRQCCLSVWPDTLHSLYFARRLLEEELRDK